MAGISSLGIGSGLELGTLVESLLSAERSPIENSLNRQESKLTTTLTGVGLMKSALSTFQSAIAGLSDSSSYSTRSGTNSNTEALKATISNDAAVGNYNIEIDNLATNQSLATSAYSSIDAEVGTGTIEIRFGSITGPGFTSFNVNADKTTQSITVDSSNNTLSGLRDEINSGDYGVTASIVNDGTGYRLTLSSENTGANNAMEISITDTGDANNTDALGLSALAYNATATNLTQTQAAEDASVKLNGLTITSATNVLDEAIEGVTLTLQQETISGSPIQLSVNESNTEVTDSITSVADAYNEMISALNELSAVGTETSAAGILAGDASLRSFTTSIRSMLTSQVEGLTGSITALADVGITTQSDGTLSVDTSKFNQAISDNPTGAVALFAPVGESTDSLISFNSGSDNTQPGTYNVDITSLATRSLLDGATGVNNLTVDADNDELTVSINGTSSGIINLTQAVYVSPENLAAEIQSQINSDSVLKAAGNSVTVSYDSTNDRFQIESDTYGSESSVEILTTDTDSAADFGLSPGSAAAGVDVAGSIGGVIATGSGQTLALESGDGSGLSIDVTGGVLGDRGSIRFTHGLIEQLNTLMNGYLDSSDGIIAAREDGLNSSLEDISDDRLDLDFRMESVEARLVAQFTALDLMISQFQTTGNFLAQQIESLPGSGQLLNNN